MKKNSTASDIAKLAKVSQSTVSRVFTPGLSVSSEKRKRVLKAAENLGYQPNALARGLITNKTKIIGIVMRDIKNPFYPEVLEKFYNELSPKGYHLLFINVENDDLKQSEVSQLLQYHVEGVIVTDVLFSSSTESLFSDKGIPIVLFNRYVKDTSCSVVCCDNYLGGEKIGEYLINTGHRNLAFISGPENTSTSIDREKGFRKALLEEGYEQIIFASGRYTYESGFERTLELLSVENPPDGIFCANDIMALGAIDAAKQSGFNVPDDVSIIGFDDVSLAKWPSYSLTTWQQPVDEMIKATIELIFEAIHKENYKPISKLIKGKLIERSSVLDRGGMK